MFFDFCELKKETSLCSCIHSNCYYIICIGRVSDQQFLGDVGWRESLPHRRLSVVKCTDHVYVQDLVRKMSVFARVPIVLFCFVLGLVAARVQIVLNFCFCF